MLLSASFMGSREMAHNLAPVLNEAAGYAHWPVLPQYPTLKPYVELLLDAPGFFTMFWNSCKQVFPIVAGQIVIGAPAAWAFARFRFRGKGVLYALYIILMLMPFQVTMVSGYFVLDRLGLMNTVWAIILPGAVSTFPVFLMIRFFCGHTVGSDGGCLLRWRRGLADLCPSGTSPWCAWHPLGGGFGISGILECVGAAYDISEGSDLMAVVALSSNGNCGKCRGLPCGFRDHADAGAADFSVWPEISGSGDRGIGNERLGSLLYGEYIIDIRTGK